SPRTPRSGMKTSGSECHLSRGNPSLRFRGFPQLNAVPFRKVGKGTLCRHPERSAAESKNQSQVISRGPSTSLRMTEQLFRLFVPGSKNLRFALRCKTGLQLRLALGWLRLEPGKRIARCVGQRTKDETFAQRALNADARTACFFAARWNPHRHVRPWRHLLSFEEIGVHPCKGGVRFVRALDGIEHLADAEFLRRAGRVIDTSLALLHHANDPFSQIAAVDDLHRIAWIARREHFAAAIEPYGPVSETIALIARTYNQSGPDD